jgi:hypothetical protein
MGKEVVRDCSIYIKVETNYRTYEEAFELDSYYHDKGYLTVEEMINGLIGWLRKHNLIEE